MAKQQWKFSSTTDLFDGARIVLEALRAGAVTLRVSRNGETIEFIRADVYLRRVRAGLHPHGHQEVLRISGHPNTSSSVPRLVNEKLSTWETNVSSALPAELSQRWLRVSPQWSAQALYEELRAVEAERSETTVSVITEE